MTGMTEEARSPAGGRPGLVVTALGPDRPGLVKELAEFVRKSGGNIEETRMSKLGGEFAFLVLVTGSEETLTTLARALPELESGIGVTCFSKRTTKGPTADGRLYRYEASGLDRTGIVEGVTHVLARHGVNVISFESWVENAPLSGTPIFHLDAEVELPGASDLAEIERELSEASSALDLDSKLSQA